MKLITFKYKRNTRLGHLTEDRKIIDFNAASHGQLPSNILDFLKRGEYNRLLAKKIAANESFSTLNLAQIKLLSPIPNPPSIREAFAFTGSNILPGNFSETRGSDKIPKFPKFQFLNHQTVNGSDKISVMPGYMDMLDFQFECAIVLGKGGRNIKARDADNHIAGYMIMNHWVCHDSDSTMERCQSECIRGIDIATSFGPYLITRDEFEMHRIRGKEGDRFDLEMTCYVNGELISRDNLKNMNWTFAQIIERASYGVDVYPGEIIGSGVCNRGSLFSRKMKNRPWLKDGDTVELSIEMMDTLKNTVVQARS